MEYIHFEAQLCNKISISRKNRILDNLSLHPSAQVCKGVAIPGLGPRLQERLAAVRKRFQGLKELLRGGWQPEIRGSDSPLHVSGASSSWGQ